MYNRVLLIIIFLTICLTTATNNVYTFLSLLIYFALLLLLFFSSLIANFFETLNVKIRFGRLILTSISAFFCGMIIINLQRKLNQYNADQLISRVEEYKKSNGKYPNENEIKIPYSINGLDIEKMKYLKDSPIYKTDYVIKYFNGLIEDKLYFSDQKTWYIDD
jgi:hypothetical protein